MSKRMWMVRSDAGRFFNDFHESNTVAIGWMDAGDVKPGEAKDKLLARMSTGKGVADVEE